MGLYSYGVELGADAALINAGTVTSRYGAHAVLFAGNDRLVIEQGAVFNGGLDFETTNNSLELAASSGTISAYGFDSITIDASASWTMTGNSASIAIDGSGTITNTGSLAGAVAARLEAGGAFTNAAGGVIDGTVYGVATAHTVTNLGKITSSSGPAIIAGNFAQVVNAGTITGTGGVAVKLAGGSRLVVDPGAAFGGSVIAQGSYNTLELATARSGSIGGLVTNFVGFDTVALAAPPTGRSPAITRWGRIH